MIKGEKTTPVKDRLLEFVQEDNGSLSATRLAFLLWVIGVLIVWIIDSIRSGILQSISGDIATIIGILMTGKVVQKFGEKPADDQGSGVPEQKSETEDNGDKSKATSPTAKEAAP